MLLLSSQPDRAWRVADISRALYVAGSAAEAQLEHMKSQGFAVSPSPGVYCYAPVDDETRTTVKELAVVYEQLRIRVIEYIYSRPSDSVLSFAHAFRIKGDAEK
ncbi:MAG TPA: hypothetical protein VIQ01_01365 [Burkholderiales bacterium]